MTTPAEWQALLQQHGGLAGEPVVTDPTIDNPDPALRKVPGYEKVPNPNPTRRYIFRDGTHLNMRWTPGAEYEDFQIVDPGTALKPPTAQDQGLSNQFPYTVYNDDGSTDTYRVGKDAKTGSWSVITDIPAEHKPATTSQRPSAPGDWVTVRENPQDPTSRVVAIMDPKTGDRQAVSPAADPTRPQIIQGQHGEILTWDGKTLTTQRAGEPQPKEGNERDTVLGGKNVHQRFEGGEWITKSIGGIADPSVPVEGRERDVVLSGKNVHQKFEGGEWVTKSVGGNADASAPFEGKARDVVLGGKNVHQQYEGGEWVTKSVGGNADPSVPVEGRERDTILNGYNVHQQYEGGEWITKSVGERAVPTAPTQLSTPANSPTLSTMDERGQIVTQPNPAFQPKTYADVATRMGQLQTLARQKQEQLLTKSAQSNGTYSSDQAVSDFQTWWDQNIEPQVAPLKAANEEAQFARMTADQQNRQQAMQTSLGAGNQAVSAFQAMQNGRVGANFDEANAAASRGDFAALGKIPGGGTGYQAPDIQQGSQQAVMDALKYISPTAAQATGMGMPNYGAVDIAGGLNRANYTFGGGPAAPPPQFLNMAPQAPAAPPAPGAPGGLLPPGFAGVPELDPRFSRQLNPAGGMTHNWAAMFGPEAQAAAFGTPYSFAG